MIRIDTTSTTVTANGLRHRVLSYGSAGAKDLLLLPGITSPAVTADFFAARIAGLGARVRVPDLRGRGETERASSGQYRLSDYAADVAGIVAALGLDRPVVLGHSLGARIAAAWSVAHAPDHDLLVLVDPPMSGPGRAPYPTTAEQFAEQLRQAQRGTTAEEVRAFWPRWPERELQLRADVLATCDETAVRETHEGFNTEDFVGIYARTSPPAVVIRGADSPVVRASDAADLAAANPAIAIHSVAGAGHMVPWDNLPAFLALLRDLLAPVLSSHRSRSAPATP